MSPCVGVKDGRCVDVCPVDCIHEGETMYYIDPEECKEEKSYIKINEEFFSHS
jgi:NAD-dependent dihydropyrimidine dehydrogenase PreA subunit